MFGDDQKDGTTQAAGSQSDASAVPAQPSSQPSSLMGAPLNMSNATPDPTAAPISEPTSAPTTDAPGAPETKPAEDTATADQSAPNNPPDLAQAADMLAKASTPSPNPPAATLADTEELLDIKKKALQELSPLVGHLDQSPEERFKTTMMMIQAADNQALVKDAYEAAEQIKDEKERAQALLDVINEINYFTHPQGEEAEEPSV